MPVFHSQDSSLGGSSLVGVADFDIGTCPEERSGLELGFIGGVCWGSQHAKEQRFLIILGFGQGERDLQMSNSCPSHFAERDCNNKEER